MSWAPGKKAIAICDRCGMQFKRNALKWQYKAQLNTGLLVCSSCLDVDNPRDRPQPWLRKIEGIAIYQPRPPDDLGFIRSIGGTFAPVTGVEIEVFPPRPIDQYTIGITAPVTSVDNTTPISGFELEDGSGRIVLEDGGVLLLEG